jgi:VanZ family protein
MKRILSLLPPLLYMALIYYLSDRPTPEILHKAPRLFGMKVVHLLEYGLLAILWFRALRHATPWSSRALCLLSVALTLAWGISDEIHQSYVPGRTARVGDAVTDLVGAVIAVWLWRLWIGRRKT